MTVQSTDAREISTRSYEKKYLTLEQKNMIIEHKETTTDRNGRFYPLDDAILHHYTMVIYLEKSLATIAAIFSRRFGRKVGKSLVHRIVKNSEVLKNDLARRKTHSNRTRPMNEDQAEFEIEESFRLFVKGEKSQIIVDMQS